MVSGEDVKLLELGSGNSSANAIVSAVPELISKIQAMFSKKKDKDSNEPINVEDISALSDSAEPEIEKVEINTEGFDF